MSDEKLINIAKKPISAFYKDLEVKLSLLTGLVDYTQIPGLTLEGVRKPLLALGAPGIGKTDGITAIIDKLNETKLKEKGIKLGFKKIILGNKVVGSLDGIPVVVDGEVHTMQVDDLPREDKDGEYGVFFIDELTTAQLEQVAPILSLADNSRNMGNYKLPEHWLVVAAGNGPEWSNFVRLDVMTSRRFRIFNIGYHWDTWRPWAKNHDVEPGIVAFLNFKPEYCCKAPDDLDIMGERVVRGFPTPSTWTDLSNAIKCYKAVGDTVEPEDMAYFAGDFVGEEAARDLQAFYLCMQNSNYDAEKIVVGQEKDPDPNIRKEDVFGVLEMCNDILGRDAKQAEADGKGSDDPALIESVANVMRWFMKMEPFDLDSCRTCITQLKNDNEYIKDIIINPKFSVACPEFDDFMDKHGAFFISLGKQGGMSMAV